MLNPGGDGAPPPDMAERAEAVKLHQSKERIEANDADLSGSLFRNVNLAGSQYDNINMSGSSFEDVNMSGWRINDVNLAGLRLTRANLAGASITDSRFDGMTIDGILVTDLLYAYHATRQGPSEPG